MIMVKNEVRKLDPGVAARIVLLRGRLGLSQKQFSELLGKSSGHMNRVENGRTPVTTQLIDSISSTFAVSKDWLEQGTGPLIVDSVGDRIRQARRSGDYTQEELAEMLHISRNSVGMIERGETRASDEVISALCSTLWINRRWLLTGAGAIERTELTPIYEMLKSDPEVRAHISSFIEHLNKARYRRHADPVDEEETAEPVEMVTARGINDVDEARRFFEHYHIKYEIDQDGQLLVLKTRFIDHERQRDAEERCRKAKISAITDHPSSFRTMDGGTVITFAPYDVEETDLPWIEKSPYNFYGYGTTMWVVKA